jgi:PAS domain S-box-containing protein
LPINGSMSMLLRRSPSRRAHTHEASVPAEATPEKPAAPTAADRFFDLSDDLCCVVRGHDGAVLRMNAACKRALGVSDGAAAGLSLDDLMHPDDGGDQGIEWRVEPAGATLLAIGRLRDEPREHESPLEEPDDGPTDLELAHGNGWLLDVAATTERGLWIGNPAGETQWADPRFAQTLGRRPDALAGHNFETFVPIARRGQLRAAIAAARRDVLPREVHTAVAGPGSAERDVLVRFHPVADGKGRCRSIVATFVGEVADVSDGGGSYTQDELLDVLGAAVIAADSAGRIVHWNAGARRLCGFTAAEAVGQPVNEFLDPDASPPELLARGEALATSGSWAGRISLRRRDGAQLPAQLHIIRPSRPRGSIATIAVVVDMSDHQDAASQLEDARGYLSAVSSSMSDGLAAMTPDGGLAYMNPRAEELLGWKLPELKGRNLHEAIHHQRPDGSPFPAHECRMARVRDGQSIYDEEDFLTRKDGTLLRVRYTAAPIQTARGERGAIMVFRELPR